MKRERQIREQTHVALIARIRRRHRKSVGHQAIVVGLTEKIASEQLPGSSFAFDLFDKMLLFRFKQFSRIREMRFVAMIGKGCDDQNEHGGKRKQCDTERPSNRPRRFFARENSEPSITRCA